MKIKSIKDYKKIKETTVLCRCDFNVHIKNKKIKDDNKIIAALPTIRFLIRYKCKIILMTHLSDSKKDKKSMSKRESNSTKIIANRLSKLLNQKISHINDCVGDKVQEKIKSLKPGQILLLEDLRRNPGEEKNDKKFAKQLAKLANIYINDAFAVSHRNHASVSSIKNYLPSYAGLLVEKEIKNLNKILKPNKPLISILGGSKVSTKAPLVKNLSKKSEKILLGGALVNNFFAANNYETGKSLIDTDSIKIAKNIKKKDIILPIDVLTTAESWKKIKEGKNIKISIKKPTEINKKDIILDIGPETINLYNQYIKKAKTIIWNGPMGYFENKKSKQGTLAIARSVALKSGGKTFCVVGGGETVDALKMTKMYGEISWVSTGGGAMLTYLSGGKMPGLKKIIK